jgi:hypothetical protein
MSTYMYKVQSEKRTGLKQAGGRKREETFDVLNGSLHSTDHQTILLVLA